MRRILIFFFGVLSPVVMSGQFVSDYGTTYTPNGTEVRLGHYYDELSDDEKAVIRSQIMAAFPNVQILDEAAKRYNCHDYAWVKSVGGPTEWMNPVGLDRTIPHITDGSYINTPITDSKATHVWYMGDDHSL